MIAESAPWKDELLKDADMIGRWAEKARPSERGSMVIFSPLEFEPTAATNARPLHSGACLHDLKSLSHSCGSKSVTMGPTVFHKPFIVCSDPTFDMN